MRLVSWCFVNGFSVGLEYAEGFGYIVLDLGVLRFVFELTLFKTSESG